jgi:plasmid replication initiation protein
MSQLRPDELNTRHSAFSKHPTNYQSNLFTESRQEFTELEKKIVTLVVNQIGHMSLKGEIQPKVNVVVQIPFMELTKARYDQVADAAESLSKKRLSLRNEKEGEFTFLTPFPLVQSALANGVRVVEITMLANVVPYFAELGQRYTKYDIDIMLSLSSVYAQRMFEIVSMYHNRGQHQFKYVVEELRTILNCPETYRYNDFCLNALAVAQRELQQKANIFLEWVPCRKQGKRVIELEFFVKTSQQLAVEAVQQDQQIINKMSINEAVTTAWQLMKGYKLKGWQKDLIVSEPSLLETFFRVDSELSNGVRANVKNPTAYLVKSLGIDQQKAPPKLKSLVTKPAATPTPILAMGPSVRAGTAQSIASIFGSIIMNENGSK